MEIDKELFSRLLAEAAHNPRLRVNLDLRNGALDSSQRMLNALLPGTQVAFHRHPHSSETVVCLYGRLDEVISDDNGKEVSRIGLCPADGRFGCQIPAGAWHTVEVLEPSVILEMKDVRYGEDGSETLEQHNGRGAVLENSTGDLRKNIEHLIDMERHSGSMEVITPLYVSRMLNVPLEDVEKVMKEIIH